MFIQCCGSFTEIIEIQNIMELQLVAITLLGCVIGYALSDPSGGTYHPHGAGYHQGYRYNYYPSDPYDENNDGLDDRYDRNRDGKPDHYSYGYAGGYGGGYHGNRAGYQGYGGYGGRYGGYGGGYGKNRGYGIPRTRGYSLGYY